MPSLLVIGECMMELRALAVGGLDSSGFEHAFAGDTYNSAVYAKRWHPSITARIFTAVGNDVISASMLNTWQKEGIDYDHVPRSRDLHPGIYAISTSEEGERSFIYWREQSAAKQMMKLLEAQGGVTTLPEVDYLYFSGISLGILSDSDKHELLEMTQHLRSQGTKVAFDPNYRPKMWRNAKHAREWMDKAYRCCDIAFPGLDDHETLYKQTNHQAIHEYLSEFEITEIVIKCNEAGVFGFGADGILVHQPFEPAPKQVDSTAAGDSFAGIYLSCRLMGVDMAKSIEDATAVARMVVQHKGAITSQEVFAQFKDGYNR